MPKTGNGAGFQRLALDNPGAQLQAQDTAVSVSLSFHSLPGWGLETNGLKAVWFPGL